MKVLLVGDFSLGALGLSYLKAFKKLGVDTTTFDYKKEGKTLFLNYFFEHCLNKSLNKKLYELIRLNDFDFIFIIKGTFIFPETLLKIKKTTNILLFNFNPDNPFNLNRGASNDLIRKSIPLYDCYFIWGEFLIPKLTEAGAKKVEYLPFAYDPELHYPTDITEEETKKFGSDIVFIGSWDSEREWWLEKIAEYDLTIFGGNWNKLAKESLLRKKWKGREVIGLDFSKVCAASKIVLNLIRKQNENAHNMRTFEVPACKGFMLTTRTKEQCEFFEEDKEITCFETPDELIDKIKRYLPDKQFRENASLAAYNKVKQNTYMERVQLIINLIKENF